MSRQSLEIDVQAFTISAALVEPTAGVVHRPGRIILFEPFGRLVGIELAPAFIERHPHPNTGEIIEMVHHFLQLPPVILPGGGLGPASI